MASVDIYVHGCHLHDDSMDEYTFTRLEVAILWISAFLVVLDNCTDWLSVQSVLFIRFIYIPLLVFVILPIILKFPQNLNIPMKLFVCFCTVYDDK